MKINKEMSMLRVMAYTPFAYIAVLTVGIVLAVFVNKGMLVSANDKTTTVIDGNNILPDATELDIIELFEEYRDNSTDIDMNNSNYPIRIIHATNDSSESNKVIVQYGSRYSDLYTVIQSPNGSYITSGVDKSVFPIGIPMTSLVHSSIFESWEYDNELKAIKKLHYKASDELSVVNIVLYNCCKLLFVENEKDGVQECYKVSKDTMIPEKLDVSEQIKLLGTMVTN